ncbi:putative inosine uridine-preferring nucleoside hydrolase protein [Coleophoma cylindrospora]|uniref:Putative inosine uridine-preferring nucleoside hydrolase protein n=1 Tax=Coleophoma cylindrospora TaxID=1849047 RepID=A0A3D8RG54_9HELO|nr:putative inosine uridine-preferring nucleoside hydrolase protein [Coleophoma cylindrospora]
MAARNVSSAIQNRIGELTPYFTDIMYGFMDALPAPRRLLNLGLAALSLGGTGTGIATGRKNLIVDTDIFSDVDDAGALLLASTLENVNLLAVNVNYPSSYSALATSAILAHYGHPYVPIGLKRPVTNESFFDDWAFELGEFASKVAYHWSNGSLLWGNADHAWDPVELYRKVLSEQDDCSVTIASIGFFDNLSGLLNSTADSYSPLSGPELIAAKVSELVIMGGEYPFGREYNFFGDNPASTAHVINTWAGRITFSGGELGSKITSGATLTVEGPENDPVRAAYRWYIGYNNSRFSWDPLTVLYAIQGLGDLFEYANEFGYNHVFPNGSNTWILDEGRSDQKWLRIKVDNVTAGKELDRLFLAGANAYMV